MARKIIQFVHPDKKREEALEQACVWLMRLDADANQQNFDELLLWLDSGMDNRKAFMEMASLWDKATILSELSDIFPLEKYAPRRMVSGRRGACIFFGTAIASVLAVNGLLFLNKKSENIEPDTEAEVSIYETSIGEQTRVILADGSEVLMNTNTQIQILFSGNDRNIVLTRGEALFTVAKDAERPFRVFAGLRIVEAVGTAFTVQRTSTDGLEVMVTEGRVNYRQVNGGSNDDTSIGAESFGRSTETELSIEAGEYIAAQKEQKTPPLKHRIQLDEIEAKLAWRHGMLLFQGESLDYVLKEVGRYTTVKIEADKEIQDIKVEGYFRTGDIESLLISIQSNFDIDVQRLSEQNIRLKALQ